MSDVMYELIKVGGPVGVTIFLLFRYLEAKDQRDSDYYNNHRKEFTRVIEKNSKAWTKNAKALTKLETTIDRLNGGG